MLKNISTLLSPDLLKILCEMGHGDEIAIVDGNFPAASNAKNLILSTGNTVCDVIDAVLSVFPLDGNSNVQATLMQVSKNDDYIPVVWDDFKAIVNKYEPENNEFEEIERYEFYKKAQNAYAIVQTTDKALYANIIFKKGVV